MLSAPWLHISGLTLLVAMVPLLLISRSYDSSIRSFFGMAGWMALTFCLWPLTAIWLAWNAADISVAIVTLVQLLLFSTAFMLYHYVSKRCRPALANVILICEWITAEYIYLNYEMPFPWLLLGEALANDAWVVHWYEYTGVLGGSLWVLISNLLIFYAIICKDRKLWILEAFWVVVPIIISCSIHFYSIATLSSNVTFYATYGNYMGSISAYIFLLSTLYYIVYRFRRKSHLIDI